MADLAQILPARGVGSLSSGSRRRASADVQLEQHRDKLTFDLLAAARSEVAGMRDEVAQLRPPRTRIAHFEESLDHIEALLNSNTPEEKAVAERRARAFLIRGAKVWGLGPDRRTGNGGIRWVGGADSVIYDADVTCGDDSALQLVPSAGILGITFRNCWYVRGRDVTKARALTAGGDATGDAKFFDCGFRDVWCQGSVAVRLQSTSNILFPAKGDRSAGFAPVAYTTISTRGEAARASMRQASSPPVWRSPSTTARSSTGLSSAGLPRARLRSSQQASPRHAGGRRVHAPPGHSVPIPAHAAAPG